MKKKERKVKDCDGAATTKKQCDDNVVVVAVVGGGEEMRRMGLVCTVVPQSLFNSNFPIV